MRFSASSFSFALILGNVAHGSNMAEIRSKRRLTKQFLDAMNQPQIFAARKKGRKQQIRKLNEALMQASRRLQNNENYDQYAQEGQQGYYDGQQVDGQSYYGQQDGDGQGYYQDENGQYFEYADGSQFDMISRSFKYAGCAAIKSYDVDRAMENGNPMVMDKYAVFRLCPADTCNDYSLSGCSSNYGEYAVDMSSYLTYILDYYDNRYQEYCEYCESCDWEYQAEAKNALSQCYQENYVNQYGGAYNGNYENDANGNNYNAQNGGNGNYQAANYAYGNNGGRKLDDQYYNANQGNYYANGGNDNNYYAEGYADAQQGNGADYQDQNQFYECRDGSQCDYCQFTVEQQYSDCDTYICGDYYTYCSDMYGNQDADFDARNYVGCAAFENENGMYYIGPHCGSDHFTVSLGVFSDENCLDYIGESVSLASVLGFQTDEEDLFKFPKECISCDGTENYQEEEQDNGEGVYGDYVTAPETDEDGVVAMCSALYVMSAPCNMHMDYVNSDMMSDDEKRYCTFIDNIMDGAFDETGEIVLKNGEFDFNDWKNLQQYKKLQLTTNQAMLLSASVLLVVVLAATALHMRRALTRQSTPWHRKFETYNYDANLSRQNSGILMGRSRSGPGNVPLI